VTTAYLTAGLPVQDTSTEEPSATAAYLTAGLAASEYPHTGYHLYIARGSLADVDFDTPDRIYPSVDLEDIEGYGFAASTKYVLVLRPVIDDLETPDISCICDFVTDGDGEWTGLRPDPVSALTAIPKSGATVQLRWSHRVVDGDTPDDFVITYGTTPAATGSSTTETYTGAAHYAKTITLSDGQTYWFKVSARAGSLESEPRRVGGVTADSSAPSSPTVTAATTWRPLT